MRRVFLILAAVAQLIVSAGQASAAGSIVVTTSLHPPNIWKYRIDCTATAGGAVSGNMVNVGAGYIYKAQFIPGAVTPTTLYDVVLNEGVGAVDLLAGTGANLSETTSKMPLFLPAVYYDGGPLDLQVSNAGAATTGTVILSVRPEP